MSKKPVRKQVIAEAVFWGLFVISTGLAAIELLSVDAMVLSPWAKQAVGYVLGGYTTLAFGYLVYKAVENRG